MEYYKIKDYTHPELKALYESVGWTVYTKSDESFIKMFEHSLYTLGAYQDTRLVGLVRTIGDGIHILYIQDILVHPDFQRQGIGKALLKTVLSRYQARQTVLITDHDNKSNAFYQACGFTKCDEINIACYLRFKK